MISKRKEISDLLSSNNTIAEKPEIAFIEDELTNNSKRSYLIQQKRNKIAVGVIFVLTIVAIVLTTLWFLRHHLKKGTLDDTYELFYDPKNDGYFNIYRS